MYKLERKLKESLLEANVFGNIFRHLGFISYILYIVYIYIKYKYIKIYNVYNIQ